jgi:hypothetical protein
MIAAAAREEASKTVRALWGAGAAGGITALQQPLPARGIWAAFPTQQQAFDFIDSHSQSHQLR